jgi:hypothetical protein
LVLPAWNLVFSAVWPCLKDQFLNFSLKVHVSWPRKFTNGRKLPEKVLSYSGANTLMSPASSLAFSAVWPCWHLHFWIFSLKIYVSWPWIEVYEWVEITCKGVGMPPECN